MKHDRHRRRRKRSDIACADRAMLRALGIMDVPRWAFRDGGRALLRRLLAARLVVIDSGMHMVRLADCEERRRTLLARWAEVVPRGLA